jgi:hypothetical protein
MQHHQFDLRAGESICLGDYKVTLVELDDDGNAVLEIEGPEGEVLKATTAAEVAEGEAALCVVA